jgi:hypothetical protein
MQRVLSCCPSAHAGARQTQPAPARSRTQVTPRRLEQRGASVPTSTRNYAARFLPRSLPRRLVVRTQTLKCSVLLCARRSSHGAPGAPARCRAAREPCRTRVAFCDYVACPTRRATEAREDWRRTRLRQNAFLRLVREWQSRLATAAKKLIRGRIFQPSLHGALLERCPRAAPTRRRALTIEQGKAQLHGFVAIRWPPMRRPRVLVPARLDLGEVAAQGTAPHVGRSMGTGDAGAFLRRRTSRILRCSLDRGWVSSADAAKCADAERLTGSGPCRSRGRRRFCRRVGRGIELWGMVT